MTKRFISLFLSVALSLSLVVGGFVPSFSASASVPQDANLNFYRLYDSMPAELQNRFTTLASSFSDWFTSNQITVFCVSDTVDGVNYLNILVFKYSRSDVRLNYYNDYGVLGINYKNRWNSYSSGASGTRSTYIVSWDSSTYNVILWDDYSGFSGNTLQWNMPLAVVDPFLTGSITAALYSPDRQASSAYNYYCNRPCYQGSDESSPVLFSANLFSDDTPTYISFDAVVFQMGSRLYLTTSDFYILSRMDPEKDDTIAVVAWYNYDSDSSESFTLGYSDLVQVYHPPVAPGTISNIPPDGHVYCFDITSWPSGSWLASFSLYSKDDQSLYAECQNLPLDLSLEEQPSIDYYSIANYYFNQYTSSVENIDPIVLQNLVEELYGVHTYSSGLAWFAPSQAVDQNSDNGMSLSRWGFYNTSFTGEYQPANHSLINYSLLTVAVVVPSAINYKLKSIVIYSGSNSTFDAVVDQGEFTFANLLSLCDAVFFADRIPVDDNGVITYQYPDFFSSSLTDSYAFLCSYYDEAAYTLESTYSGYCIVLDRGVQKSMLYNFSDGIVKIYDFLQQYTQSHDNWISSQILWQSSMFNELQAIVGKLNSLDNNVGYIASHIQSIVDNLQKIADNTSESENGFWYLPLFNFILRFKPTDSDFSSAIEAIDSTWEQLTPIPAAPSPPLIPTLYPVSTPALPGG